MNLRILNEHDRPAFRALRLEALRTDPDSFMMTVEEERAIPKLMVEQLLDHPGTVSFFLGAAQDGALVGMVGMLTSPQRKRRHVGEVLSLYVRPAYRAQGIGRQLMQTAIRRAFSNPEIQRIKLQVVAGNRSALLLYQNLGFVQTGVEPNAYNDGERGFDLIDMNLNRPETLFA
jgi:ribosomal protein S18 acetylase RimI-like enzyme